MRGLCFASAAFLMMTKFASAERFEEVTVGVPVSSVANAEAWYLDFFGHDTEVLRPVPGVVEFNIAPGFWFQIFETNDPQPSAATVRFLVDDIGVSQAEWAEVGIKTGEPVHVPDVVTFTEFSDPDGNPLGLYDLP